MVRRKNDASMQDAVPRVNSELRTSGYYSALGEVADSLEEDAGCIDEPTVCVARPHKTPDEDEAFGRQQAVRGTNTAERQPARAEHAGGQGSARDAFPSEQRLRDLSAALSSGISAIASRVQDTAASEPPVQPPEREADVAYRNDPARFKLIQESKDGLLSLFEDGEGHIQAVRTSRLI